MAETETPVSDEELVTAIKLKQLRSDPWAQLLKRHGSLVLRTTRRFSPDDQSRQKDLAQKTWMQVFQKIDSFEGRSKFSTWLVTITRNICISETRKNSWAPAEESQDIPVIDTPSEKLACVDQVWMIFKEKNPTCFTLLQLYWTIDYTWAEVGERLGKSATAAKQQGNECLHKFKPLAQKLCGDNDD